MTTNVVGRHAVHPAPHAAMLIALVALLLLPMVILSLTPWHANSSIWYLGMLPAVIGLFTSARLSFAAAFLTPFLMGSALVIRDAPIAGAVFMSAIAVCTGISAQRGWHLMLSFAAPLTAFALIGQIDVALPSGTVAASSSLESGLFFAGFTFVGGAWTALLGQFIIRAFPMKSPRTFPLRTSCYFAGALGVLVGIATYIAMTLLDADSWWLVLTIFVVVQPLYSDSLKRSAARAVGTLGGALVTIMIVALFHDLTLLLTVLSLGLTIAAAWANVKLPYWVFVVFLTPAVLLQTTGGANAIVDNALERASYTLIGTAAAIAVMTIGHFSLMVRN